MRTREKERPAPYQKGPPPQQQQPREEPSGRAWEQFIDAWPKAKRDYREMIKAYAKEQSRKSEFVPKGPRSVKKISGITSFTYWPVLMRRRILITGERHSVGQVCDQADPSSWQYHTWLRALGDTAPECLDVLVESDYLTTKVPGAVQPSWQKITGKSTVNWPKGVPVGEHRYNDMQEYGSPLVAVYASYEKCFSTDPALRTRCAGSNTRFHYIDMRSFVREGHLGQLYGSPRGLLVDERLYDPAVYQRMLEYTLKLNTDPDLFMREMARMCGQNGIRFDESTEMGIQAEIEDKFEKAERKFDRRYDSRRMRELLVEYHLGLNMASKSWTKDKSLDGIYNCIIEAYALFRMFETFETAKLPRGPEGCRDAESVHMRNIIYHGGEAHSNALRYVLLKYLSRPPAINISIETTPTGDPIPRACIELPDYFDYFA